METKECMTFIKNKTNVLLTIIKFTIVMIVIIIRIIIIMINIVKNGVNLKLIYAQFVNQMNILELIAEITIAETFLNILNLKMDLYVYHASLKHNKY